MQRERIAALSVSQVSGVVAVGSGNNIQWLVVFTAEFNFAAFDKCLLLGFISVADDQVKIFDSIRSGIAAEHFVLHRKSQLPVFHQRTNAVRRVAQGRVAGSYTT